MVPVRCVHDDAILRWFSQEERFYGQTLRSQSSIEQTADPRHPSIHTVVGNASLKRAKHPWYSTGCFPRTAANLGVTRLQLGRCLMSRSFFSTRLYRILVYGLIIFGVAPLALALLLLLAQATQVTVPFLTAYCVIAIFGLALIAFERLMNEIRRSPTSIS